MAEFDNVQLALNLDQKLAALRAQLHQYERLAIAVSGGVDSVTLCAVAHEVLGKGALMVHAVSPAVPSEATERVRLYSQQRGWELRIVDAGELADERYKSNPVDRCYYCKSNLYARIRQVWTGQVASGANLDDLGDYRPGLLAAKEKQVVHPLVDAGIDKATIRLLADRFCLDLMSDLPAQPCLSSRIETGIAIDPEDLAFVHRVETLLAQKLGAGDHRCRITASGVRIEVPQRCFQSQSQGWQAGCDEIATLVDSDGRKLAGFSQYEKGSAFLTQRDAVHKTTRRYTLKSDQILRSTINGLCGESAEPIKSTANNTKQTSP